MVPISLHGGASHALVRLRWDNSYAWVHSKTIVRRVDVLLPGDKENDVATELERDDAEARAKEREGNIAAFPQAHQLKAFPGAVVQAPEV